MSALTDLLAEWMPHQRWFGGKGREWASVTEDGFFLDESTPAVSVHRVRVTYADDATETYLVPLSWRPPPTTTSRTPTWARSGTTTPTTACATARPPCRG